MPAKYRGIVVRIEDDVVVTAKGCTILADDSPRERGDVEAWMAGIWASLPQAPSRLALDKNMPAALARSRLILAIMSEEGWITEPQEMLALNHRPALAPPPAAEGDIGYVLDLAAAEAVRQVGPGSPDLVIRLTIDSALQAQAQTVVRRILASDGKRAGAAVVLVRR